MSDQNEKQAVTIEAIKSDKKLTECAIQRILSDFADRNSVNVESVNLRTAMSLSAYGQKQSVFYYVEMCVSI